MIQQLHSWAYIWMKIRLNYTCTSMLIAALFTRAKTCVHTKSLQSCLTLCNPMDCSLPGSSVHGNSSDKNIGVGCHALLQGIFLTQGSNPCILWLLHLKWIHYHWATGEANSLSSPLLLLFGSSHSHYYHESLFCNSMSSHQSSSREDSYQWDSRKIPKWFDKCNVLWNPCGT